MTPFRISTIIGLVLVCLVLVAGCTVAKTSDGKVALGYGTNHRIESPPVFPTTSIPTRSQIPSTPVQPSIYWILIDPIGDKNVGEIFTVNSTTNLSVGYPILVQVYSSSWHPGGKSQTGEFSGLVQTVKVNEGRNGTNSISVVVNSSAFIPNEYIITEDAFYTDSTGNMKPYATGGALFNITTKTV